MDLEELVQRVRLDTHQFQQQQARFESSVRSMGQRVVQEFNPATDSVNELLTTLNNLNTAANQFASGGLANITRNLKEMVAAAGAASSYLQRFGAIGQRPDVPPGTVTNADQERVRRDWARMRAANLLGISPDAPGGDSAEEARRREVWRRGRRAATAAQDSYNARFGPIGGGRDLDQAIEAHYRDVWRAGLRDPRSAFSLDSPPADTSRLGLRDFTRTMQDVHAQPRGGGGRGGRKFGWHGLIGAGILGRLAGSILPGGGPGGGEGAVLGMLAGGPVGAAVGGTIGAVGGSAMHVAGMGVHLMVHGLEKALHLTEEMVKHAIHLSFEYQRAAAAFEALGGGHNVLDTIRGMATRSPLSLESLTQGGEQLLSMGFGPGQAAPILGRLGDIAHGDPRRLEALVTTFGRVREMGAVTGQNIRQLTSLGVGKADLAHTMGIPIEQFNAQMNAVGIPISVLAETFNRLTSAGGRFFDIQNKELGRTVGAWEALKNTVEVVLGNLGTKAMEKMGLGGMMNAGRSSLLGFFDEERIDKIAAGFGRVWDRLKEGYERISPAVGSGLQKLFGIDSGDDFASSLDKVIVKITAVGEWMAKAFERNASTIHDIALDFAQIAENLVKIASTKGGIVDVLVQGAKIASFAVKETTAADAKGEWKPPWYLPQLSAMKFFWDNSYGLLGGGSEPGQQQVRQLPTRRMAGGGDLAGALFGWPGKERINLGFELDPTARNVWGETNNRLIQGYDPFTKFRVAVSAIERARFMTPAVGAAGAFGMGMGGPLGMAFGGIDMTQKAKGMDNQATGLALFDAYQGARQGMKMPYDALPPTALAGSTQAQDIINYSQQQMTIQEEIAATLATANALHNNQLQVMEIIKGNVDSFIKAMGGVVNSGQRP